MNKKDKIKNALRRTYILKMPKSCLSTFGITNIEYYVLSSLSDGTRIREGRVISNKPQIVNPFELDGLFEGFGEYGERYAEEFLEIIGENTKILNYRFKNIPGSSSRMSESLAEVITKVRNEINEKEKNLAAIIKGDDETWNISIMKFIVEMTLRSAGENIAELEEHGLFPDRSGVPKYVKNRIEYLFEKAKTNKAAVEELGNLLNKYKLFSQYEDRFFRLFK